VVSTQASRAAGASDAVALRAGKLPVPKNWEAVSHYAAKIKELIDSCEAVSLRVSSGREFSLAASDSMTDFIKDGFFTLYKNPKADTDVDDNGRTHWYAAYYLVPTPKFGALDKELAKLGARQDKITKAISTAMDKLHNVIHASRVNGFSPIDLPALKAEVAAALPEAKAAVIAYEQAVQQFKSDTQLLPYPEGGVFLTTLAHDALVANAPHIDEPCLRDVIFVKDLIRANELLMTRPEVEAVDPGWGIRICVNTDTLVANGGDYNAYKTEISKQLQDHLITGQVQFDKNNNWDKVEARAKALLNQALGTRDVVQSMSRGDKDFPDHVRGTEVVFYLKSGVDVAAARRQIDAIKALYAPHGMDMKHFSLRIETTP